MEPPLKKVKTGIGLVSAWPKFSERVDENEEKEFFLDEGYVKLIDFLSPDEVGAIRSELDRYQKEVVPDLPPKRAFFEKKDDASSVIRLERMADFDDYFKDLSESPAFNGLADILLGVDCEPNNVQFFSKPPGAKDTPPHQDGIYFMHDKGITFWLALDDVDAENGAMSYIPKSHKLGELKHNKTDQLGFSKALDEFPESMKKDAVMMEVKKGKVVLAFLFCNCFLPYLSTIMLIMLIN
ncbi:probable alpha-ketoglutarate-dependent hypophosphite dioxygenase isoform X2 [Anneissia japonica]|uniref:probable alpha-ketoglutarate-dependent hypophosphite dioxygenase isoform X2 n=1 Tax=Anneissia japonica TaxID=1529436 RepID=UPI0014257D32|nr:probable alpha-ketoglutarate-dependent hypophosphite dioxygenase isoform X2 [Anneissia japonica]